VLTETVHLVQRVAGVGAASVLVSSIHDGASSIFDLTAAHLPRMLELMDKYRDLPMDLADASLVICAEETEDGRILSTDTRDFGAYRWKRRKPFKNLLRT
jgi:predicted nucleic acid-binding protein